MKRLLAVAIVGLLGACGSASNGTADALSFDLKSNLPKCDANNQSAVAYVKAEKAFYSCQDGAWELATTAENTSTPAIKSVATVSPTATPTPITTPEPFSLQKAKSSVADGAHPCFGVRPNEENQIVTPQGSYDNSRSYFVYVPRQYVKAAGCTVWYDEKGDRWQAYGDLPGIVPPDTWTNTTTCSKATLDEINANPSHYHMQVESMAGPQLSQ